MSGENSCFSRFLVKFVEVSAAGLATAISAYALAHLGGLLSSLYVVRAFRTVGLAI